MKLYLSFDAEDEKRIFDSELKIQNERIARDLLFDVAHHNSRENPVEESK
jgi:hypothetical protein